MFFAILSIIFLAYFIGLVIYSGISTKFVFVWLFMSLVTGIFSYIYKTGIYHKIPGICLKGFWTVVAVGGISFLVIEGFIISGCFEKGRDNLDYVIVLGAGVRPEGNPSRALMKRLDKAYEYYENNPETVFVLSGGKGGDEPISEAECMNRYLMDKGMPQDRILLEAQSENTKENIAYSKKLIPENSSIGIISNNFHIYRALKIAQKNGLNQAVGIAAKGDAYTSINNFTREFFGVLSMYIETE